MANGKFRLHYTHEHVQHPAVGVHYRLTNTETGQYFSFGVTDAQGDTKPVEASQKPASCSLDVMNAVTGDYEAPDLHGNVGTSTNPRMRLGGGG